MRRGGVGAGGEDPNEIDGVQYAMGHDGGEQMVAVLVEPDKDHGEDGEGHKGHQACVGGGKEDRSEPEGETRVADLFDGGVEDAAEEGLLGHGGEGNGG